MKIILPFLFVFIFSSASGQTQSCPVNSDFSQGTLTDWSAYTGNNKNGNGPGSIKMTYAAGQPVPTGTNGVVSLPEYGLPEVNGIRVITSSSTDPFGNFPTIPNINGFQYSNSVLLGSTSITRGGGGTTLGGYTRGISYKILVPSSPSTQPYTMTYAYAMVLENGQHNSNSQPLISATLTTNDSVITCASPAYFLPTEGNANSGGGGATLDSAVAYSNGFFPSKKPSPNPNPNSQNGGFLYDVWTKGWTEVTFDLSPYRGQVVTLTFEADNCVPGGHFAYGYIALRNTCNGLQISGPGVACINSDLMYSIPALSGASYEWLVPPGWNVKSGGNNNILIVTVGNQPGKIIAHEVNGCADLRDTIAVTTTPPTVPGTMSGNNEVCATGNTDPLVLSGQVGNILAWIASTDNGQSWTAIPDSTAFYTAQNLQATTLFRALVQNGASCNIDTSTASTIIVDPKSVAGVMTPPVKNICIGQDQGAVLVLTGSTGGVVNWQSSQDATNWTDFGPTYQDTSYNITGLATNTQYRAIVKSGVCPADISTIASLNILNVQFPKAASEPADTAICYGGTATLNGVITIGTSYAWINNILRPGQTAGAIPSTPFAVSENVSPLKTSDYILQVENSGCPNLLTDTFHVFVHNKITVDAGRDTVIVINQPLQLQAVSSDTLEDAFAWTPATGLDNPLVPNPIAVLGKNTDSIRYTVTATAPSGCFGTAQKLVTVFKTLPEIFVPSAFTPGKGTNNVLRPIPVGVAYLQFFRIFNRWGQQVYATSAIGQGWDGTLNGRPQESGSFVYMVQGQDYTGRTIFRKGTVILIR